MKILWLTWKDKKHPAAGGAEVVNEELAKRLVKDGHEVVFICGAYTGGDAYEERDGFKIYRAGNKYTAFISAFFLYWKKFSNWPDLVIDEMNTVPYFSCFYVKQKKFLFVHQLCREIWFQQILFPVSLVGYLLEPLYLWLQRNMQVITVSNSTKQDLMKYGFKEKNISIISEGIELEPVSREHFDNIKKFDQPTVLSLGAIRPMKRTLEIVKAFEFLKNDLPEAKLVIAGDTGGSYGKSVVDYIEKSKVRDSITVKGRVSQSEKIELMQKSHALAVTSLKEGWGLVVTEAGSQGTPSVVYNVDGLRDSVTHGGTGYISKENNPQSLASSLHFLLNNVVNYNLVRQHAWEQSIQINFTNSYSDFLNSIK
jgi:glycosyltransferase involved in cell wall biosynthesis